MRILKSSIDEFENVVTQYFSFLEKDFGFIYAGLSVLQEDPRDSYVSAKYRSNDLRVDVVWNPMAKSLGIFIKVNNNDLSRQEKFIYFEPFVEFISGGSIKPAVPQIYPGMSMGGIEKAMGQRDKCFENGISCMVKKLAKRFREYYQMLESAPIETIKQYHDWYVSKRKTAQ